MPHGGPGSDIRAPHLPTNHRGPPFGLGSCPARRGPAHRGPDGRSDSEAAPGILVSVWAAGPPLTMRPSATISEDFFPSPVRVTSVTSNGVRGQPAARSGARARAHHLRRIRASAAPPARDPARFRSVTASVPGRRPPCSPHSPLLLPPRCRAPSPRHSLRHPSPSRRSLPALRPLPAAGR